MVIHLEVSKILRINQLIEMQSEKQQMQQKIEDQTEALIWIEICMILLQNMKLVKM